MGNIILKCVSILMSLQVHTSIIWKSNSKCFVKCHQIQKQYCSRMRIDLHCHRAHDRSLVTLQSLQSNLSYLVLCLAEKLLAGRQQHLLILTLDLDLNNQQSSQSVNIIPTQKEEN